MSRKTTRSGKKSTKWVPRPGQRYWFVAIRDNGDAEMRRGCRSGPSDGAYHVNVFRTKADAMKAMRKIQHILREGSRV